MTKIASNASENIRENGFARFDPSGRLLEVNKAILPGTDDSLPQAMLGMSENRILDVILSDFREVASRDPGNKEQRDQIIQTWRAPGAAMKARRSNGTQQLLSSYTHNDGGRCYLSIKTAEPEEALGTFAERDAADLLHSVVEACPANFLMSRLEDGKVLYRSPASEALFGNPDRARNHWADPADRISYLERLKRDQSVDGMYVRGRKADESEFPSQVSARLVKFRGEQVIVSSTTDLTEAFALRDDIERANARLRDAIETLGEGFMLYDEEGKFVMANDHCRQVMAPYKHLMVPGAPLRDVLRQAVQDGHATVLNAPEDDLGSILKAVRADKPVQADVRFADGMHRIVTLSRLGDGGLVMTMLDISDHRLAQDRARELLEDAVEALGEGVALYDSDLRMKMNNRAFRKLVFNDQPLSKPGTHLTDEVRRVVQAGLIETRDGDDLDSVLEWIVEAMRNGVTGIELPMAGGRTLEVSNFVTPLGGYLISMRDITETKEAKRATREADELVRTIVEASPTTFLVSRVDDGKIIYAPSASRERFGNITSTLSFFLTPEDRVRYLDALLPTGSVEDYPVRFRRMDGSVMNGLTSARVITYKGEQIIVSSTRDITDQLAMQAELEQQRELAHQNEKLSALGELLAGVAHELNNPLSIIVGYALMLEGKLDDPVLRKRVDRISQAAGRSSKIIKTFLAMARQRPTKIEVCSLNEIVAMALDVAGYGLKANGTKITLELEESIPNVTGDADQLAQVFTNLIVNAEHVLDEKGLEGELVLRSFYDASSEHTVVEVRDNGAGIPEDIKCRIFEPFFTTKDVGKGTGVGLAFCHRIINTHGGRLTLETVLDEGSSFFVKLPSAKDDIPAAEAPAKTISTRRRILVLDDEENVAELISDLLTEIGYDVTTKYNGHDALETLSQEKFCAVLSDFKMPGLDGEDFFNALTNRQPHYRKRIGFVTGDTMGGRVAKFLASANCPHIEKPLAAEELYELVEGLCSAKDKGD